MSYSRWARQWPGGGRSWYIYGDVSGCLAVWPSEASPMLNNRDVAHLREILTRYLEDEGGLPEQPLNAAERRELEAMRSHRQWEKDFRAEYGHISSKKQWLRSKQDMEKRLAALEEDVEYWRERAFASEEAFSSLRDGIIEKEQA